MNEETPKASKKRTLGGALGDGSQCCASPGCKRPGEFRAPRLSGDSGSGRWKYLCLDHVRQFNSSYDFFDGMNEDAIYAAQHPTSGWADRTAWADGSTGTPRWQDFHDPLEAISARYKAGDARTRPPKNSHSRSDNQALKILGLKAGADQKSIRRAYTEKLQRYHPDRNGGDRRHEKALQQVISAYTQLKKSKAIG